MLFKIFYSFFYTQIVVYFVQKQVILIRSNPTNLRCIADKTRPKYDQPTLYPRPSRFIPTQHTTCGAGSSPTIFNRLKNLSRPPRPLRAGPTNSRCILDQHILSPIKARYLPIRPFSIAGESEVDRLAGVNGPLQLVPFSCLTSC